MKRHSGFTLIELLVVIAIIGILAGLVIASIGRARALARAATCASNLRQIGTGLLLHAGENRGSLPPGAVWDRAIAPWLDIKNTDVFTPLLHCPLDVRPATILQPRSYTASAQKPSNPGSGVFSKDATTPSLRLEQFSTPSMTVLVAELFNGSNLQFRQSFSWTEGWLGAAGVPRLPDGQEYHGNGANYLFADGHVKRHPARDIYAASGINSGRWRAFQP
ncbi:MAG: prepilin-type N-terminal cleavage/methylation domain-containing protein [Opitutaceae bacterium]|jgi:prepilin-type N-terminal cleavage/methylation domain-containing protein/prepilin-type processing-associated H-X9-DG protein|nr:prepilin-type N-terminal cleavage/methylation domain-containing protein [Opitutaceae bacterium]